jgi:hypothetical protein
LRALLHLGATILATLACNILLVLLSFFFVFPVQHPQHLIGVVQNGAFRGRFR